MRCDQVQQALHAYLHGEGSPDERMAVERHLSTCQACTEEAAVLTRIGHKLSSGLTKWVDEGTCPITVLTQIERQLRGPKHTWWQRWGSVVGTASAAAVVLVLLVAVEYSLPTRTHSGSPFPTGIGGIKEAPGQGAIGVDTGHGSPGPSVEQHGLTLTLWKADKTGQGLHVVYSVQGSNLDTQANPSRFQAVVQGLGTTVALVRATVTRQSNTVFVDGYFDVPADGRPLTLTIEQLPVRRSPLLRLWGDKLYEGPWSLDLLTS